MSSDGRLVRRIMPFERNYTQIPNAWLRDSRLTFKARGIRDLLLSHTDGWRVTLKDLAADGPDGIAAIRAGVEELEKFGYLVRRPNRRGTADDWDLCDPSGLFEPAPFTPSELVDNTHSKIKRTRHASENRTRHASENRTLVEDQLRNKKLPETTTEPSRSPVDNKTCSNGHELIDDRHCVLGCPVRELVSS